MKRGVSTALIATYVFGLGACLLSGFAVLSTLQSGQTLTPQFLPTPLLLVILSLLPILILIRLWTHIRARRAASLAEASIMESDDV